MGIPSELRDMWVSHRKGFLIASPAEEKKILRTVPCLYEGLRPGFKAGVIVYVAGAVPLLAAFHMIPWARANLSFFPLAFFVSATAGGTFFVITDNTTLECARRNAQLKESLRHNR